MPTSGQSAIATFDQLRIVAFGSITGSYVALGTPLGHMMRIVTFINSTNEDVEVSIDGTNNYIYVPAGTNHSFEFSTNRETACNFYLPIGTQFYVKYVSAPSSGNFVIECVYGVGE